jgi:sulfide:quinone oxidoreductase
MISRDSDDRVRVLVAGAGVGGLEAALALRARAGEFVRVDVMAPERCFTYRPLSVNEPFGEAGTVQAQLRDIAAERGFGLIRDALESVDAAGKRVRTQDGTMLGYDALVLALGARPVTAVPGAVTFRGPRDVRRLAAALEAVADRPSPAITFVAGASAAWTLPLYELALLTETWARGRSLSPEIRIVTAEHRPLEAFGPQASAEVAELLARRGISVHTSTLARDVVGDGLRVPGQGAIPADLAVALPSLTGPAVVGLPRAGLGFMPVDDFCRVDGLDDVYAVGDMTQHAVKQGGLAAQMADVAAASVAAAAGAPVRPKPFAPVLRGLLLTGGRPLYLRNPPASEAPDAARDGEPVAPWWPSHKIVGAHLGPYLATHADMLVPVAAAA